MTRRFGFLRGLAGLAVLSFLATPAAAQVYNNGTPNTIFIPPDGVETENGHPMTAANLAEDFVLGSPLTTLASVRFWGADYTAAPDYTGSIFWQIWSNGVGTPGALLLFSGSGNPTTTGFPTVNAELTGRQLDLDISASNVSLAAGTYWLALHNGDYNTVPQGQDFYWLTTGSNLVNMASSPGVGDDNPYCDQGTNPTCAGEWLVLGDGDSESPDEEHAFQLFAGEGAVVPEPAALGLLATGLVALAGAGALRRRKQDH